MEILRQFNKYQSNFNELSKGLPEEVIKDVISAIEDYKYIENLTSINRPRYEDLDKLDDGRIIVDLSNPHILEDMDYFRQAAIRFQKTGKYTDALKSNHKKSAWAQFWRKEAIKCLTYVVNPSNGEWIPGDYYFYLNYSPILRIKTDDHGQEVDRVIDFPDVYDGDYLYYHYLYKARHYSDKFIKGMHGGCIKARGKGYSFKSGGQLAKRYVLGDSLRSQKQVKAFALASEKEFLTKDGVLNKFVDIVRHCADHTGWSKSNIKSSWNSMEWRSGYVTNDGFERGRRNEVLGVSMKDNSGKARGKRAQLILYEEFGKFPNFLDSWRTNRPSTEAGPVAFGQQVAYGTGGETGSNFQGAEELIYHPIGYRVYGIPNVYDRSADGSTHSIFFSSEVLNMEGYYDRDGNSDVIGALFHIMNDRYTIKYNSSDPMALTGHIAEHPISIAEAIMRREGTLFPVVDLRDHLAELTLKYDDIQGAHYIGDLVFNKESNVEWRLNGDIKPIIKYPAKDNKEGAIEIFEMPKKNGRGEIDGWRYIGGCLLPGEQVLTNNGLTNVENVTLEDKLINQDGNIVDIYNLQRHLVKNEETYEIKVANTLRTTAFTKEHPILTSNRKTRFISYNKSKRLGISQRYYEFDFKYKLAENVNTEDWIKVPNIYKKIIHIDFNKLWDNKNVRIDRHIDNPLNSEDFWWFVGLWLGDGWCEKNKHNITIALNKKEDVYIKRLTKIIETLFKRSASIRERDGALEIGFCNKQLNALLTKTFGKGADSKLIPEWVKYLPHNFKYKLLQGYLDSDGCITRNKKYYSTEFVSINLKLLESIQDILFSIGVVSSLSKLRDSGEHIIDGRISIVKETYHLRISHSDTLIFVNLLNDNSDHKISRIHFNNLPELRRNPKNNCYLDDSGDYIYFKVVSVKKDIFSGVVYNFECDTHTFMCHHITTHNCDPVDDDEAVQSVSLCSIFIFDMLTDRIVAEYTGRPKFADDFYEIARRMLIFYNAKVNYENNKKGLYSYFNKKNSTHLLAPTPQILRDQELIRHIGYGNTAFGTNASKGVNQWGRRLLRDWLLESAYTQQYDNEGNQVGNRLNLHTIRGKATLEELIKWNPDGNFDRVSALGMVMIYREDRKKYIEQKSGEDSYKKKEDPYFSNNYMR